MFISFLCELNMFEKNCFMTDAILMPLFWSGIELSHLAISHTGNQTGINFVVSHYFLKSIAEPIGAEPLREACIYNLGQNKWEIFTPLPPPHLKSRMENGAFWLLRGFILDLGGGGGGWGFAVPFYSVQDCSFVV